MASSSSTNPAYNVPAFNGRDRLVAIHQEITDFLHYQSHVRFAATKSLPPHTSAANEQERETIIEFLKEERARCNGTIQFGLGSISKVPRRSPATRPPCSALPRGTPSPELRVPSSESDGAHSHRPALYVPHGRLEARSI